MPELTAEVQSAVTTLAIGVVVALLSFLARLAHVALRRAFAWLDGMSSSEAWKAASHRLDTAASIAVDTVEATVVKELMQLPPTGRLTTEQAAEALRKAVQIAMQQLGPRAREEIQSLMGVSEQGLAQLMVDRIEAAHHGRKFYRQTGGRMVEDTGDDAAATTRRETVKA